MGNSENIVLKQTLKFVLAKLKEIVAVLEGECDDK